MKKITLLILILSISVPSKLFAISDGDILAFVKRERYVGRIKDTTEIEFEKSLNILNHEFKYKLSMKNKARLEKLGELRPLLLDAGAKELLKDPIIEYWLVMNSYRWWRDVRDYEWEEEEKRYKSLQEKERSREKVKK